MDVNVGQIDQVIRGIVGPSLVAAALVRLGARQGQPMGLLALAGGALMIESAITRVCPLNAALGINTARPSSEDDRRATAGDGRSEVRTRCDQSKRANPVNVPIDALLDESNAAILLDQESDIGVDRIVTAEEAGLGRGLDQAEEALLGITDEEIEKQRGGDI